MAENELCYKAPELAKLLGISLPTLYQAISAGRIPSIKISERRILIPKAAINRMLGQAGREKEN